MADGRKDREKEREKEGGKNDLANEKHRCHAETNGRPIVMPMSSSLRSKENKNEKKKGKAFAENERTEETQPRDEVDVTVDNLRSDKDCKKVSEGSERRLEEGSGKKEADKDWDTEKEKERDREKERRKKVKDREAAQAEAAEKEKPATWGLPASVEAPAGSVSSETSREVATSSIATSSPGSSSRSRSSSASSSSAASSRSASVTSSPASSLPSTPTSDSPRLSDRDSEDKAAKRKKKKKEEKKEQEGKRRDKKKKEMKEKHRKADAAALHETERPLAEHESLASEGKEGKRRRRRSTKGSPRSPRDPQELERRHSPQPERASSTPECEPPAAAASSTGKQEQRSSREPSTASADGDDVDKNDKKPTEAAKMYVSDSTLVKTRSPRATGPRIGKAVSAPPQMTHVHSGGSVSAPLPALPNARSTSKEFTLRQLDRMFEDEADKEAAAVAAANSAVRERLSSHSLRNCKTADESPASDASKKMYTTASARNLVLSSMPDMSSLVCSAPASPSPLRQKEDFDGGDDEGQGQVLGEVLTGSGKVFRMRSRRGGVKVISLQAKRRQKSHTLEFDFRPHGADEQEGTRQADSGSREVDATSGATDMSSKDLRKSISFDSAVEYKRIVQGQRSSLAMTDSDEEEDEDLEETEAEVAASPVREILSGSGKRVIIVQDGENDVQDDQTAAADSSQGLPIHTRTTKASGSRRLSVDSQMNEDKSSRLSSSPPAKSKYNMILRPKRESRQLSIGIINLHSAQLFNGPSSSPREPLVSPSGAAVPSVAIAEKLMHRKVKKRERKCNTAILSPRHVQKAAKPFLGVP